MIDVSLVEKYNVPVPRYTSYPTVPYWKEGIDVQQWQDTFQRDYKNASNDKGIALYIHLPFCESLCTYCGCNKKITTNHSVEEEYIVALLKEWALYRALLPEKPIIKELHLGGGTPTFFSPANLNRLLKGIFESAIVPTENEFSFEGHPNNTTREHLQQLYDLGFRRVSFGIQDHDPEVQRIINRIQPIQNVRFVTSTAREIGYQSVNFDLIYGLPRQSLASITTTIEQTIALRPDRIAFYSYAHVPWTSKGQRLFDENDLPSSDEKMQLYLTGKQLLLNSGYTDIGMDHFSLAGDDLLKASEEGRLHRNFMGYTTSNSEILLGLGVSAISGTPGAFAQNAKVLQHYYDHLNEGNLPVEKGYFLSATDQQFGKYILDVSCKGRTTFRDGDMEIINAYVLPGLQKLAEDGLVALAGQHLSVTPKGRNFTRNICSCFDLYLQQANVEKGRRTFSKAI